MEKGGERMWVWQIKEGDRFRYHQSAIPWMVVKITPKRVVFVDGKGLRMWGHKRVEDAIKSKILQFLG